MNAMASSAEHPQVDVRKRGEILMLAIFGSLLTIKY